MQAMMKVAQIVMAEEFDPSFKQNKFSVEEVNLLYESYADSKL